MENIIQFLRGFISNNDAKMILALAVLNISFYIIVEFIRRFLGFGGTFSRKIIHLFVGLWSSSVFFIFDRKETAILLPVLFILSNIKLIRKRIFAISGINGDNHPGTFYYPISMFLLFWFCWGDNSRWAGVTGLINLAVGDSLASIFGSRYGKIKYTIGDSTKTYLGSLVMFISCFVSTLIVLFFANDGFLCQFLLPALAVSLGATLAESFCGKGLDNISVPLLSAIGYSFFYLK